MTSSALQFAQRLVSDFGSGEGRWVSVPPTQASYRALSSRYAESSGTISARFRELRGLGIVAARRRSDALRLDTDALDAATTVVSMPQAAAVNPAAPPPGAAPPDDSDTPAQRPDPIALIERCLDLGDDNLLAHKCLDAIILSLGHTDFARVARGMREECADRQEEKEEEIIKIPTSLPSPSRARAAQEPRKVRANAAQTWTAGKVETATTELCDAVRRLYGDETGGLRDARGIAARLSERGLSGAQYATVILHLLCELETARPGPMPMREPVAVLAARLADCWDDQYLDMPELPARSRDADSIGDLISAVLGRIDADRAAAYDEPAQPHIQNALWGACHVYVRDPGVDGDYVVCWPDEQPDQMACAPHRMPHREPCPPDCAHLRLVRAAHARRSESPASAVS